MEVVLILIVFSSGFLACPIRERIRLGGIYFEEFNYDCAE